MGGSEVSLYFYLNIYLTLDGGERLAVWFRSLTLEQAASGTRRVAAYTGFIFRLDAVGNSKIVASFGNQNTEYLELGSFKWV
jgi:hypothetical protein